MAKPKTIYRCTECGYESAKWNGKCPSCGAWNTLEEDVPLPAQAVGNSRRKPVDLSDKIQELDEVDTTADVRYHTGVGELDRENLTACCMSPARNLPSRSSFVRSVWA